MSAPMVFRPGGCVRLLAVVAGLVALAGCGGGSDAGVPPTSPQAIDGESYESTLTVEGWQFDLALPPGYAEAEADFQLDRAYENAMGERVVVSSRNWRGTSEALREYFCSKLSRFGTEERIPELRAEVAVVNDRVVLWHFRAEEPGGREVVRTATVVAAQSLYELDFEFEPGGPLADDVGDLVAGLVPKPDGVVDDESTADLSWEVGDIDEECGFATS